MSFQGKNALITGSSRGIGRGIALKPAAKGARLAVRYQSHTTGRAQYYCNDFGSEWFLGLFLSRRGTNSWHKRGFSLYAIE